MWSKHKTSFIISGALTLLLAAFWFVQSFALVMFISLLLSILLTPLVDKLQQQRLPRALAAFIILTAFTALLLTLFVHISKTFLPSLAHFASELPRLASTLSFSADLPQPLVDELNDLLNNFAAFSLTALQSSLELAVSLFSKVLDTVIILFITFYLLKDGIAIKSYLVHLFPKTEHARVAGLLDNIIWSLSRYIRGQLLICMISAIFVFLYFTCMNLPYASIFAVLSGLSEFIPVVGPTIASGFGIIIALTSSLTVSVQTGLFYLFLTQINHNVIYPYVIGRSLRLHPIAILLAILLGGQLLSVVGMFLAVPCLVILKLVAEDIAKHA